MFMATGDLMGKMLFITGIGTGVGKTLVTCILARKLQEEGRKVMAIKPIISGWGDDAITNDTMQILTSLHMTHSEENIKKISPWRFKAPLAPSMAARMEDTQVDYSALVKFCNHSLDSHEYLLIEGAGGVMTPLTENKVILDLICDLECKIILVAGSYLGAISHTLTAVKALESEGLTLSCIIVSESESGINFQDCVSELQNFTNYPTLPMHRMGQHNSEVSIANKLSQYL